MNIDDKTLNKIAKRPIRLLINSEKYKDIDITTAHISKKDFILFNLQNKNGEVLDLSKKWQEFKHKIEELENMQQMGA